MLINAGEFGGKTPCWSGAAEFALWGEASEAGLAQPGEKTTAGSNSSPPARENVLRRPYQERERVSALVHREKMGNNSHSLKQVKLSLGIKRNFSPWEQWGTWRDFQKICEIFILEGFWDLDRPNHKKPNSDLTDYCVLGILRPCPTWIFPWTYVISSIYPGTH